MENLAFKVEMLELESGKECLALVYPNDVGVDVKFIYKERPIFGGWYCLNTKSKVNKKVSKILSDAFTKVCEGIGNREVDCGKKAS